jgi:GWxTD domain-containing protein
MRRIDIPAWAVGILIFFFGLAGAFPIKSKGALDFWVDGASFASDSGQTWQEIYWSIRAGDFTARDTLGRKMALFRTEILLKDQKGALVLNEGWNSLSPLPTEQMLKQKDMVLLDQVEARRLKPGSYNLLMTITDLAGEKQGMVDTIFDVPGYGDLGLSHIELSSGIAVDSIPGRFKKGSLTVKPWPSRVFDDELYYYYEIYNLAAAADTLNKRYLRVLYFSEKDPAQKIISHKEIASNPGPLSDYGGLRIDDLPEGRYRLRAQLIQGSRILANSYANFEITHPGMIMLAEKEKIAGEIAQMERDGGGYSDRIEYIGAKQQIDLLSKLDENGKKELLRRFWKQRDPLPETKENEALIAHAQRCRYADQNFAENFAGGLKGSQTERGRIYIKYGPWDDRDITTNALQNRPHDIWSYDNGRKFIFFDKAGIGKFELLYSKTSEEKTDPEYRQYISDY